MATDGIFQTDSSEYGFKIVLTIEHGTSAYAKSKVTVQPYLCRKYKQETRYQHDWDVYFKVSSDPNNVITKGYHGGSMGYLPNNTAYDGVVSAGRLTMEAGTYYRWGSGCTFEVKNDGTTYGFSCRMVCSGGRVAPRHCPDKTGYATVYWDSPEYKVDAPKPTRLIAEFAIDTRELKYYWEAANCSYIELSRTWYDADGVVLKEGNLGGKIYNTDCPIVEYLDDEVATVTWSMTNVSITGDEETASGPTVAVPTDCKVWVKAGNQWKKATPWIKVNGVWKKANKAYVKVGSEWKRTIM